MSFKSSLVCQWLLNTPDRALERAYNASKRIRNVQTDYVCYKQQFPLKSSWYNISLYMDTVLEEVSSQIYWALLEFQVSQFVLYKIRSMLVNKNWNPLIQQNVDIILSDIIIYPIFVRYTDFPQISLQHITRKLAWIEAALTDLNVFKYKSCQFSASIIYYKNVLPTVFFSTVTNIIPKGVAYESVGLVPRSITRTLLRFQTELAGRSSSLVLPEFRLAKYQATASVQYMICLIFLPWLFSIFCKMFILQPLIESWWNTAQFQIFFNTSQEQKALRRLQEIEELLWLDIVIASASKKKIQDLFW